MKTLFHFLGGVHFAILLILFTLIFVVAGTLLESWSHSHLFAAAWTYHSPIFSILLWLFFLNILIAALRRWPFEKKHIPFLLTHLGLLLLLLGAFVKNTFGTQGQIGLSEGMETTFLFRPNTYALYLEDRVTAAQIPLRFGQKGEVITPFEGLEACILDWTPHAHENLDGWVYENAVHLVGLPPFPLFTYLNNEARPSLRTPHYTLWGIKEASPHEVTLPSVGIAFIEDREKKCHLLAQNEKGERYHTPLDTDALMIFDKGFRGYGYFSQIPETFPDLELISPIRREVYAKPPPRKVEERTPALRLLLTQDGKSEVIPLIYDPYSSKLKWPALEGRYLLRFVSRREKLPHTLRLRQARQINYPGTEQPLSYESDVVVDGQELTISMNHVHETKKHYRFYMANLYTPFQNGAARAQIVVNRDPGKYIFTYPGALILAFGIAGLFIKKRYV